MAGSGKASAPSGQGEIRRLWPTERDLFTAHLLRLDPETRRERFGTAVNDAFLENYAVTTFGIGEIVYAYVEDGEVRGAGELRGLEEILSSTGEAAFSVERPWRRRGIGDQRIASVERAKSATGSAIAACRPKRSPASPPTSAPSGRMPKVAVVSVALTRPSRAGGVTA